MSPSPVDGLSSLLTPAQVSKFAQKAVAELKLGQASLKSSLENKQWETSAKQAHRLKSTMGIFSADSLVSSLDLIESGQQSVISLPEFTRSLMTQCDDLIESLESYLATVVSTK